MRHSGSYRRVANLGGDSRGDDLGILRTYGREDEGITVRDGAITPCEGGREQLGLDRYTALEGTRGEDSEMVETDSE